MLSLDIFYNININGETFSVKLEADCSIVNDGIGAYEYCGSREYDEGQTYIKAENITWEYDLYTLEENEAIRKEADSYDVQEAFGEEYKRYIDMNF